MTTSRGLWLFVFALSLAGCLGAGGSGNGAVSGPGQVDLEQHGLLVVTVVDPEVIPIADALVRIDPGGREAVTDEAGVARFAPLDPAAYDVYAGRPGYRDVTTVTRVIIGQNDLLVTLEPVSTDVPYRATEVYAVQVFCRWAVEAIGSSVPCNPVPPEAVGLPTMGYNCCFEFRIASPGLANLLHEMDWQSQAYGREMGVEIASTELTQAQAQTFLLSNGPSPHRNWMVPGETAAGGDAPFVGADGTAYVGAHPVGARNSTVPGVAIVLDLRVDNWLTFFYNRPGPTGFTILPDE